MDSVQISKREYEQLKQEIVKLRRVRVAALEVYEKDNIYLHDSDVSIAHDELGKALKESQ